MRVFTMIAAGVFIAKHICFMYRNKISREIWRMYNNLHFKEVDYDMACRNFISFIVISYCFRNILNIFDSTKAHVELILR